MEDIVFTSVFFLIMIVGFALRMAHMEVKEKDQNEKKL